MKIAHIVSTFPPYFGGMGNVVFQMVNELSARGHEVEVFTPGYYRPEEIKDKKEEPVESHAPEVQEQIDFVTRVTPKIQYGNAAYIPQIEKELLDFDIVHLHYPFFGTANMIRNWKRKNSYKSLAVTYHMDTRGTGWKGLFFKYYSKFWMPKILESADVLIGSSFDYITNSQAGHLYKKNPEKWVELPFGVDTDRFQPRGKDADLSDALGLQTGVPTLLFVGGMDRAHYFKGVPLLLEALAILKRNNFDVQTVLVGEGDLRSGFVEKSKFLDLEDRTVFVGAVSDEDLPFFYNLADLFVLPSINQGEAFGMVLLEAMASGVPVLASDLPGMRSVAKDGGNVFMANDPQDLAASIAQFFSSVDNIGAWGQRARQSAEEKYSWPSIIDRLENIYQQIL